MAANDHNQEATNFFLPDFCSLPMVFAVVVLSELFAVIITLAPVDPAADFWHDLALASLFMQWVGLWGALLLCGVRRYLAGLGNIAAGIISWFALIVLVIGFSEGAYRLFGDPLTFPALRDHGAFLLHNAALGAIVSALALRYFYVQHQWAQRMRAESAARIEALQARIRPHFLFNSMNTIASLTRTDPAKAEEGIEDLSDLFRASLRDADRPIPLAEELELARRYVHMESLRLGERLTVEWRIEAPEQARLPALTLQPLLENAVYHGIEPRPEGGTVVVEAVRDGARVRLSVTNPLPSAGTPARTEGSRMALENIGERLRAHFGRRALLETAEREGRFRVTVVVPYHPGE